MTRPIALTIAGSDSGGGAGIQADLKTFQAFGCFGTSALTAITAQNTRGVRAVHPVPTDIVRAQIDAVVEDLPPSGMKTGMLATGDLVETVAAAIHDHGLANYVLDPVMVATSGDRLLDQDAESAVGAALVPLCTVTTPNLDEASILVGYGVTDEAGMRAAAADLVGMGAQAALVKGGHGRGEILLDVLYDGADFHVWRHARQETTSTHGTGCTLSAAIAAGLARGLGVVTATDVALNYLQRAIAAAPGLGSGHGPVNHAIAPELPG